MWSIAAKCASVMKCRWEARCRFSLGKPWCRRVNLHCAPWRNSFLISWWRPAYCDSSRNTASSPHPRRSGAPSGRALLRHRGEKPETPCVQAFHGRPSMRVPSLPPRRSRLSHALPDRQVTGEAGTEGVSWCSRPLNRSRGSCLREDG